MTFRKPKKGRPVVATPYLHCAGLGNRLGHSDEDALEMLNRILDAADCNLSDASMTDERDSNNSNDYSVLGVGERIPFRLTPAQIHLVEGASYIFLEFASLAHSAQALEVLERSTVLDSATSASGHRTERHLRVSYAEVRAPVSPADGVRCTSRYSVAKPQGLMLWPDVISEEDEKTLLAVIDALPWDESTLARRVQHYGYTFQYGFRSIDFLNNAPSMPECFHDLVLKPFLSAGLISADCFPDQVTVNEYLPGQGIAAHVDTHEAFGHTLLSLSLVSGVVMDFRHCLGPVVRTKPSAIRRTDLLQTANPDSGANSPTDRVETAANTVSNSKLPDVDCEPHNTDTSAAKPMDSFAKEGHDSSEEAKSRLLLWLPPRSLLVLSDDSRYSWSHGIAPRKVDRVCGEMVPRTGRRVSLTFRKVLRPGEACICGCGAVSADAQNSAKLNA